MPEHATVPLAGILVADFSRVLAGPLAASALADLGATVIKVERSHVGDDTRHWGPPWTDNSSSYFESANRSKKSIELDLADPADRVLAQELAQRADVLIENFKVGSLANFGLDYESVSRTNPWVVYCSISGFGSREGAELAGYDFLVQAVGGLMSITGEPDGDPLKVGVALVDVLTSKDAVIGILGALRAREATGSGQRVEVNLLSSLLGSLANQAAAFVMTGKVPERMGNEHPSIAPYETVRCQDGHLALCCGNDGQFGRLAKAIGRPELATDDRFATNSARVANRRELLQILKDAFGLEPVETWVSRLRIAGVPAGGVGTIADAFQLAESLGLDPVVPLADAPSQVRNPITYSATPIEGYSAPPRLGQHNEEVRQWLANKIPEENDQCRRDRA
jgi:formyl-CoA transferase